MNATRTAMLLAAMTALFMVVGFLLGGRGGATVALGLAAVLNLFSWWNADRIALAMHGAEPVDRRRAPELVAMVERLAARAGLPMPRVHVIHTPQPNAFATGRNPANAAVAVTTGLIERLAPDELEGVIAHELAHIEARDTLIMTVTATLAGAISTLANVAFLFGGSRDGRAPFGPIGAILVAVTAPFAAMLVQMAISRTREYAADVRAAEISGRPLSLARALRRISAEASAMPMMTAERNPASAHLFIVNPLSGERMDNLFSTHPATENRVAALQAIAEGAGGRLAAPAGRSLTDYLPEDLPARTGPDDDPWSRPSGAPGRASSPAGPWERAMRRRTVTAPRRRGPWG